MRLYLIYQRYDFESKSQPSSLPFRAYNLLYLIYQRYDFESKSQRSSYDAWTKFCCISYTKGTTLKANHN